mmetsp:Transcript_18364/g.38574  ORF Transcript_18364/g.38574 Transcript_18364/m.38574 type:complete len:136 (+) Transcript_18364:134-541(+)
MVDPDEEFDLTQLRGTSTTFEGKVMGRNEDDDLTALSELVPDVKNRKHESTGMVIEDQASGGEGVENETPNVVPQGSPVESKKPDSPQQEAFVGEDDSSSENIDDVLYAGDNVNSEPDLGNSGEDRNDVHQKKRD